MGRGVGGQTLSEKSICLLMWNLALAYKSFLVKLIVNQMLTCMLYILEEKLVL